MTTLGSVTTAIARRLLDENNTAVTLVEIREAVNEAIQYWKHKRFWFNSAEAALTIDEDDDSIDLPSDFLVEIPRNALIIIESGSSYKVEKVGPVLFDARSSTSSTGRPSSFINRNGNLQITPAANQSYSGKLYYIKDYDDFATDGTADSTSNDFLNNALALVQSHALANLFAELRHDIEMESRYTSKAEMEYNNLLRRTNKALRSGSLTIEQ